MSAHKSAQSNKGDTNDIDNLFELYKFENMMRPLLQEEGYDLVDFKKAIQNLIAQETTKARIDELEMSAFMYTNPVVLMRDGAYKWTQDRIKALKGEQDD